MQEQNKLSLWKEYKKAKRFFVYPKNSKTPKSMSLNPNNILTKIHFTDKISTNSAFNIRDIINDRYQVSIRKNDILGLKTNKEDTDLFPPFLVLYTDFSAGRAEPMDQEITWCSSQSGMQDKVTALRAEYIKGGWNKVN